MLDRKYDESRRAFLRGTGLSLLGVIFSGCGTKDNQEELTPEEKIYSEVTCAIEEIKVHQSYEIHIPDDGTGTIVERFTDEKGKKWALILTTTHTLSEDAPISTIDINCGDTLIERGLYVNHNDLSRNRRRAYIASGSNGASVVLVPAGNDVNKNPKVAELSNNTDFDLGESIVGPSIMFEKDKDGNLKPPKLEINLYSVTGVGFTTEFVEIGTVLTDVVQLNGEPIESGSGSLGRKNGRGNLVIQGSGHGDKRKTYATIVTKDEVEKLSQQAKALKAEVEALLEE